MSVKAETCKYSNFIVDVVVLVQMCRAKTYGCIMEFQMILLEKKIAPFHHLVFLFVTPYSTFTNDIIHISNLRDHFGHCSFELYPKLCTCKNVKNKTSIYWYDYSQLIYIMCDSIVFHDSKRIWKKKDPERERERMNHVSFTVCVQTGYALRIRINIFPTELSGRQSLQWNTISTSMCDKKAMVTKSIDLILCTRT